MSQLRVLLADDCQPVLHSVEQLLAAADFQVVGAVADGSALLEAVESLHPDVCVVDICMPVMNGIEATRRLRANRPDLAIIILTVHGDGPMVRKAQAAGASGYVVKARLVTDLPGAIREVAAGKNFVSPCIS